MFIFLGLLGIICLTIGGFVGSMMPFYLKAGISFFALTFWFFGLPQHESWDKVDVRAKMFAYMIFWSLLVGMWLTWLIK